MDGVPFLYNGQEVADAARHSIFGRLPINWANGETPAGRSRFAFVQKLCALRRAERALTQGELAWLDNDAPEAVLSFARKLGDGQVLAVINLTDKPVRVSVKGAGEAYTPLLSKGSQGDAQHGFELEGNAYFAGKK